MNCPDGTERGCVKLAAQVTVNAKCLPAGITAAEAVICRTS